MGTKHTLLATFLGWLITAAGRQVSDIVKNEMQVTLGLEERWQVSLVVDLSFWIGYIITALLLGIWSDKIGRKKIIYFSLLLFSIPTGLIYLTNIYTFVYVRFFQGLAVGGFFPVAVALLGDLNEVSSRSKAVGRFVAGGIFGAIIGWLVSGIVYDASGSWQLSFLVVVPPIAGVAVINYFLLEESPVVRNPTESKEDILSPWATIKKLLKNKFLVIALLFCALDLFTLWVVDDWLPYYVKAVFAISSTEAAIFRAVSAFAGILGILFFGYYADKFGRKKALITAVGGGLIAVILLTISSFTLPFQYMYPLSAAVGFFGLGEFAAIYVLVMENAPASRHGTAMGLCIFIGNAIALTGGPIAALLSDYTFLGLTAFLVVPFIAIAIRLPLSLIAKDPAFLGLGEDLKN
jgi:MFS family permease